MQIKDNVAHGVGREDKRLLAVLHRFKEHGITLRREKCRLGQTEAIWFGNVFNKGKAEHVPRPRQGGHYQGVASPRGQDSPEVIPADDPVLLPIHESRGGADILGHHCPAQTTHSAGKAFQVDSFIRSPCNSTNLHQIPYQCPGTVRR